MKHIKWFVLFHYTDKVLIHHINGILRQINELHLWNQSLSARNVLNGSCRNERLSVVKYLSVCPPHTSLPRQFTEAK
jgi:hypothetical protein